METREYFEKVMQDYNQNRKGRSLRKYCKDYDRLIEFKKSYRSNMLQPNENKKLGPTDMRNGREGLSGNGKRIMMKKSK